MMNVYLCKSIIIEILFVNYMVLFNDMYNIFMLKFCPMVYHNSNWLRLINICGLECMMYG